MKQHHTKLHTASEMPATNAGAQITTEQGVPLKDDLNSLKMGNTGPILLEDFILRDKITHFDHERIPERVVHARGFGAHGYFENYGDLSNVTSADLFQRKGEKTPAFVRFSTVAGSKGSRDLARDVRGFAVKLYTKEGNWDIVGNNIPVFFIQDPMQFPDLVHAAKEEPDRGFPQAQTAHDNFWDFISGTPESMHMIMWAMSDRGIPRSFRTMEGFGVHSFRLVNKDGKSTYVKFIWKPKQGLQSVVWDEALKISGADPDFHRRDLWEAIQRGDYPEWELGFQMFDDDFADKFDFDILDSTKLIPEEIIPLQMVGKLVLNRCVDNFFAETEQVAFCTQHVVPGIDFTNDPLLAGRNFSYQDTQITRLGGPNFAQIPINRPQCPMAHFHQDGFHAHVNPKGRTNYSPNSIGEGTPRDGNHLEKRGFRSYPFPEKSNVKIRERNPDRFADHYSQARQFYKSQTKIEQVHIQNALIFEVSKCGDFPETRKKIVAMLMNIDDDLATKVKKGLGITENIEKRKPQREPIDLPVAKSLSIIANTKKSFAGRKVGVLVTDGVDDSLLDALKSACKEKKVVVEIIGLTVEGTQTKQGKNLKADQKLEGAPSVLYDAVVILASKDGVQKFAKRPAATQFFNDAFVHAKFVGYSSEVKPFWEKIGLASDLDDGCFEITSADHIAKFLEACNQLRFWDRENKLSFA